MGYNQKISEKQHSLPSLLPLVEAWRAQGETIVFTNGCFDLLHLGHVDYLSRAADLGTKLVVAVNSDASVRALKGASRPLQGERSRLALLAALECVAAVFVFEEATPLLCIKAILPHILVKGADYKTDDIVGADVVLQHGGSVQTVALVQGYSTTLIEQKVAANLRPNLL